MMKQKDMVESFQMSHRSYMKTLNDCLKKLEDDFEESREIDNVCTGEWCRAVELSFDEIAKELYSISEPRWVSDDYSRTLRNMRRRLHDLYAKYHGRTQHSTH
jgi:chromosome condensin MukBEF ATPase and DNA-binding subunit MukB